MVCCDDKGSFTGLKQRICFAIGVRYYGLRQGSRLRGWGQQGGGGRRIRGCVVGSGRGRICGKGYIGRGERSERGWNRSRRGSTPA